ncbi:MAG TPA: response regulator transcription factor, partial [Ochrobactrum intermedium]
MHVLIVEDDPLHRAYLGEAVRAALPECSDVLEAENGSAGEKLARQHRAAHIVMDLQM